MSASPSPKASPSSSGTTTPVASAAESPAHSASPAPSTPGASAGSASSSQSSCDGGGGDGGPYPKATLSCRPNSHPFQDRTLTLDQPVKVGRSVARARPAANNAIFDCKVLSRNHALLW